MDTENYYRNFYLLGSQDASLGPRELKNLNAFLHPALCPPYYALLNPQWQAEKVPVLEALHGQGHNASDYVLRISEHEPMYAPYREADLPRVPSDMALPSNGIMLATSLAPKRLTAQQDAVDTWLMQGFDVVSINYQEEIDVLAPYFSQVRFCLPQRDSRAQLGKARVYMSEAFALLAQLGTRYEAVGLINSDVGLYQLDADKLIAASRKGLVCCPRMSLPDKKPYAFGVDAFFATAATCALFTPESHDFVLGEPWWDYVPPLECMHRGIAICQAVPPLCYHIEHHQAWDWRAYYRYGKAFLQRVQEVAPALPLIDRDKLVQPLRATGHVKHLAELFVYIYGRQPWHEGFHAEHVAPVARNTETEQPHDSQGQNTENTIIALNEREQLKLTGRLLRGYNAEMFATKLETGRCYHYPNGSFEFADAFWMYSLFAAQKPGRVLSLGYDFSTCLLLDAVGQSSHVVEMRTISRRCKRVQLHLDAVKSPATCLESASLARVPTAHFTALQSGDFLCLAPAALEEYAESMEYLTHSLLPQLPAGVLLHLPDVFYAVQSRRMGHALAEHKAARFFEPLLYAGSGWEIVLFADWLDKEQATMLEKNAPLCRTHKGGSLWLRKVF